MTEQSLHEVLANVQRDSPGAEMGKDQALAALADKIASDVRTYRPSAGPFVLSAGGDAQPSHPTVDEMYE